MKVFRTHVLPTVGAVLVLFAAIALFPRRWLDVFGASDTVKGLVVVGVALGCAWFAHEGLKPKR